MPASTRAGQQHSDAPPPGFVPIRGLLERQYRTGGLYSVVGVVSDFRAPVETRGTDWKCQISLYDHSTSQLGDENILLNVFLPQKEMPDAGLGDIAVVVRAKLQDQSGVCTLITNKSTDIHVFHGQKIPRPPSSARKALRPSPRATTHKPDDVLYAYVSTFCHSIPKLKLPTVAEFEDKKLKSANYMGASKFHLLEKVRDMIFVDMIVQIVKDPYSDGDLCTLWVSDYTENSSFFKFAFKGLNSNPFGYGTGMNMVDQFGSVWPGPFGQRSLQLTCFEPHSSFIRDNGLVLGDWVHLRNVQIKFGHNGQNLEGFLRHDMDANSGKVQVSRLDWRQDPDTLDPRLKEAVGRKRTYEKLKKSQMDKLMKELQHATGKQQPAEADSHVSKSTSKNRRKQKRAHLQQQDAMSEVNDMDLEETIVHQEPRAEPKAEQVRSLNNHVKCEHQNQPTSTIAEILRGPGPVHTIIDGEEVSLEVPFRNVNYRANVRVVNFMPPHLEDFAYAKKVSEFDILLHEGSEDSESDPESDPDRGPLANATRSWEWRFFLELQDASPETDEESSRGKSKGPRDTIWVMVDNLSAQCLVDLDAADLSRDAETLELLKQRMFFLWGELEEFKTRASEKKKKLLLTRPPPDSDDDDDDHDEPMEDEDEEQVRQDAQDARDRGFINRPFGCCISEYGFKVPESDPSKADAGHGKRWQRAFALFGTRITA